MKRAFTDSLREAQTPGISPAVPGQRPGWMAFVQDWQLPLTLVFLILGFVMASQVRTQQVIRSSAEQNRVDVLASKLQDAQGRVELMREEINTLRKKLTDYEDAASARDRLIEEMNKQLQEAKMEAGLIAVRGPGIQVILEDSPQRAATVQEQEAYLIHDIDLLQLVNELKAAGAEAVSINGQRVVAMSEIRCVGPTIKVNGTPVASPFTVNCIGDPATLKSALELPMGILETLQALKIRTKVVKKESLLIPAVATGPKFRFSRPAPSAQVPKGETSP
jgi:uncharacterized protein YlxW (UPF0749 family)